MRTAFIETEDKNYSNEELIMLFGMDKVDFARAMIDQHFNDKTYKLEQEKDEKWLVETLKDLVFSGGVPKNIIKDSPETYEKMIDILETSCLDAISHWSNLTNAELIMTKVLDRKIEVCTRDVELKARMFIP